MHRTEGWLAHVEQAPLDWLMGHAAVACCIEALVVLWQ